jgi:hypothetical protein
MKFKIENTEVYGLNKSIVASGNAMRTTIDDNTCAHNHNDYKRACALGNTKSGEGHDNFLNGVVVQFDIYAPLYMWKQLQRYHFLDFISSQSTMHRLAKFDIKSQCVANVDYYILQRYQDLLDVYNDWEKLCGNDKEKEKNELWRTLVASLPCGFVLGATMTTNYRQLKTIYNQRKNHRLVEWHEFCKWCEELPLFKELIING